MNWQPIETAPKNRRILLYYNDDLYIQLTVCGQWTDDEWAKNPMPYWVTDGLLARGKRWHRLNNPSHWAELTPPEET